MTCFCDYFEYKTKTENTHFLINYGQIPLWTKFITFTVTSAKLKKKRNTIPGYELEYCLIYPLILIGTPL